MPNEQVFSKERIGFVILKSGVYGLIAHKSKAGASFEEASRTVITFVSLNTRGKDQRKAPQREGVVVAQLLRYGICLTILLDIK